MRTDTSKPPRTAPNTSATTCGSTTATNIVYWYHGIDLKGGEEHKVFASEFGDDYYAIPAYEQIYALAGPVQTYRMTGDRAILKDADMTIDLFKRFFRDDKGGGYFSHIDP